MAVFFFNNLENNKGNDNQKGSAERTKLSVYPLAVPDRLDEHSALKQLALEDVSTKSGINDINDMSRKLLGCAPGIGALRYVQNLLVEEPRVT